MAAVVEIAAIGSATGSSSATAGPITPAGSNRHLIGFGANTAGSLANYLDMTWGGAGMTPKVNTTNPSYQRVVAEELNAPAASSASLVYTAAAAQDEIIACAIALSGVDSTTPTDAYQTNSADGSDPMSVAVTIPSGDLGLAWFYSISGSIATGDTPISEVENVGGEVSAFAASKAGSASSMTGTRGSILLNDWIAIGVNVNASSGAGPQSITLNGYAAPAVFGADAVAPGAVAVSLNGLVARGIYGALTVGSTYPITLNPVVAQAIFGAHSVSPGAVNIAPGSVIGQAIFGAFAAALGSTQDIQPGSVVGRGVYGSFNLAPGALNLTLGDTVARGVEGTFSVQPGSVAVSFTGVVAQGIPGPLVMSYVITMNGIVAKASFGGLAVNVGPVTLLPGSIVAQSEFGPIVVAFEGATPALVLESRVHLHTGVGVG